LARERRNVIELTRGDGSPPFTSCATATLTGDLGAGYHDSLAPSSQTPQLMERLEKLGFDVSRAEPEIDRQPPVL
jgi:hypothetical protein